MGICVNNVTHWYRHSSEIYRQNVIGQWYDAGTQGLEYIFFNENRENGSIVHVFHTPPPLTFHITCILVM